MVVKKKKMLARKRRRRGRAKRHLMPQSATRKRALANRQKITAANYNIRTMIVDVLSTCDRLGCDNIGPTAVGTQFRLSFWCTAAVDAVARMVGEKSNTE